MEDGDFDILRFYLGSNTIEDIEKTSKDEKSEYITRVCIQKPGESSEDCTKVSENLDQVIFEYIVNNLRNKSIACGGPALIMVGSVSTVDEQGAEVTSTDYTGLYDYDILMSQLAYNKIELVGDMSNLLKYNKPVNKFKQYYDTCQSPYIYFDLRIAYLSASDKIDQDGHAEGILINKERNEITIIEPAYNNPTKIDDMLEKRIIIFALTVLKMPKPVLKPILTTCPQAITRDENCMFWQLYEVMLLFSKDIDLDSDTGPTEAIRNFMNSQTKESLTTIIENFKLQLLQDIIPKAIESHFKKLYPDARAYVDPKSQLGIVLEKYKNTKPIPLYGKGYNKRKRTKRSKRKARKTRRR